MPLQKIYKHRKTGLQIFSAVPLPTKKGDRLYFIRIGEKAVRLHKIGTSNSLMRRMKDHLRSYEQDIYILWISPIYSKWTTIRIEAKHIEKWAKENNWEYVRNDRFIIPENVEKISIVVRKEWTFSLE